jgi:predicted esterase
VIPQVFWPERGVPQEAVADCDATLAHLREDLVFQASVALHGAGDDGHTFASQLSTFDARMLAIHDACGDRPAYDPLFAYRYALAMEVERHHDDVAPRAERADALFPPSTESSSP